jgi:hypothetical protein
MTFYSATENETSFSQNREESKFAFLLLAITVNASASV